MQTYLIDMLQCPACSGDLIWEISEQQGDHIEQATARCQGCEQAYPVQGGIGIFLVSELIQEDHQEQAASLLKQFLRANPGVEQRLLSSSQEKLNPTDQYYRALLLEERGQYGQAATVFHVANAGMYSPEYLICYESQMHYLVDHLAGSSQPVIDLASSRGDLAAHILRETQRPVVLTGLNPSSVQHSRRRLEAAGLYLRTSLLVLDPRCTPFRSHAIKLLASDLGLAHLRRPERLLEELRRVVEGRFLAIHHFYPENDLPNREALEELQLGELLLRSNAQRAFGAAGWKMMPANLCQARAAPTPASLLLNGARIDPLPAAETELEWCTLFCE